MDGGVSPVKAATSSESANPIQQPKAVLGQKVNVFVHRERGGVGG